MAQFSVSLYFCKKCKKIVEAKKARIHGQYIICPECNVILSYFGREFAKISAHSVLKQYDQTHEFDPIGSYKSHAYTDFSKSISMTELLECEDMLSHHPDDTDALEFLSKYYYSQRQFIQAASYLEKIVKQHKKHRLANNLLTDIHIYNKNFDKAVLTIRNLLLTQKTSLSFEKLGYCFLKLNNMENAFEAFMRAKTLAKTTESHTRLNKVLAQLTTEKDS